MFWEEGKKPNQMLQVDLERASNYAKYDGKKTEYFLFHVS